MNKGILQQAKDLLHTANRHPDKFVRIEAKCELLQLAESHPLEVSRARGWWAARPPEHKK